MTDGMTRWDSQGRPPWHHAHEWSPHRVQPGDSLLATTAHGDERECVAVSGYEGIYHGGDRKVHDFPVIWVRFTTKGDRLPWPVESLRPREEKDPAHEGRGE